MSVGDDFVERVSKDAQGADLFIFKHREIYGKEKFDTSQTVDVNGIEDDEESLRKIINCFFRFLIEVGWESDYISYNVSEVLNQYDEVVIADNLENDPLTKDDDQFKLFLQRIGSGDPKFLQELYDLYRSMRSLN